MSHHPGKSLHRLFWLIAPLLLIAGWLVWRQLAPAADLPPNQACYDDPNLVITTADLIFDGALLTSVSENGQRLPDGNEGLPAGTHLFTINELYKGNAPAGNELAAAIQAPAGDALYDFAPLLQTGQIYLVFAANTAEAPGAIVFCLAGLDSPHGRTLLSAIRAIERES
ncbi:MAG: hypothetical protein KDE59_22415 [Anaerolineales bacterium]|nr:hypothetical protein [Anaerolineales bacterium]